VKPLGTWDYVIEKGHIRYQGTMGELVANEEVKAKYLMI